MRSEQDVRDAIKAFEIKRDHHYEIPGEIFLGLATDIAIDALNWVIDSDRPYVDSVERIVADFRRARDEVRHSPNN